MAGKSNEKKPSVVLMGLKTVLAALILGVFLLFVAGMAGLIGEQYQWTNKDTARMIDQCNRYYYERDLGGLREILCLNDLYGEEYDVYWEAADANSDYYSWLGFFRAGDTASEQKMFEQIKENAENCSFSQNQKLLDQFVQDASDQRSP